jgi:hypothetical protein
MKGCTDKSIIHATNVSVEDSDGPLTISAVYLPPKHAIKQEKLGEFYNTLGHRFIARGDWLLGRKSKLSTNNKLLIYKAILKPIWSYGIQLWGTASTSNIEILGRFQPNPLAHVNGSTMQIR